MSYLIISILLTGYNLFAVITGVVSFLPATFSLLIIYILEIKIIRLPRNIDIVGVSKKM